MDQNIKKPENLNDLEKRISSGERAMEWMKKNPESAKEKLPSEDEKAISEELRREIELMNVDDNLKKLAEQKALKIQALADDDKLKKLLEVAREKGLVFAVKVAKSMNDPYLLDTLHDILAKEGFYQKFIK